MLDRAQETVRLDQVVGVGAGTIVPARDQRAPGCRRVPRSRSAGMRPPQISCWVWTKNSISRIPPRPSLTLWPATVTRAAAAMGVDLPLDRMDVVDRREVQMLAPDERRQIGEEGPPAARSPATGRALIIAARSQFWPTLS